MTRSEAACRIGRRAAILLRDEAGQSLIEYALVAFLIGLAAVAAMTTLSNKIAAAYGTVNSMLQAAT